MSWTLEDIARIQAQYGESAIVTKENGALQIKIDETKIDRLAFINLWMQTVLRQTPIDVSIKYTATLKKEADFEMVKAAAEKHGLQLVAVDGEDSIYRIVPKDKGGQ